ncbi:MAG: LacI family DNA-binding transcriptional regulator [Candidatus Methylacidiphilales bacterium]|nr:LacI family DNA-binding transcriptional regulator [Candidatus Methylacidiphilales bacterium]
MEPGARITQKELAEKCKVSQTTVSRALARSPLLSEETTQRILNEAEKMGYRPDPVLASLNSYLHARRPISAGSVIAWLGKYQSPDTARLPVWDSTVYRAAHQRARTLGYNLDYFWVNDPALSSRRLAKILSARNVAGLILDTQNRAYGRVMINCRDYPAVAIGRTVYSPRVDQVSPDHFTMMVTCYRRLLGLGYRRIGLAITERFAQRSHGQWYGGFLVEQARKHGPGPAIPILSAPDDDDDLFREWVKKWSPDCIITALESSVRGLRYASSLAKLGLRIPQDIGLVVLNLYETGVLSHYTGMEEPLGSLGAGAVNILARRIGHNERGEPEARMVCLIEGKWVPGNTTVRKR